MNIQIRCLARLFQLTTCQYDILDFLLEEKLITTDHILSIKNSDPKLISSHIYATLETLKAEDRIQLVDYVWNLLPVESICVTIVSDSSKKEFTYTK